MVLDPVSALSVAAAVVQFVDFSTKLVSKTREMRISIDGRTVEHRHIEAVTQSLAGHCDILRQMESRTGSHQQSLAGQNILATVTQRALDAAVDLRSVVDLIYFSSINKTFKSFR